MKEKGKIYWEIMTKRPNLDQEGYSWHDVKWWAEDWRSLAGEDVGTGLQAGDIRVLQQWRKGQCSWTT